MRRSRVICSDDESDDNVPLGGCHLSTIGNHIQQLSESIITPVPTHIASSSSLSSQIEHSNSPHFVKRLSSCSDSVTNSTDSSESTSDTDSSDSNVSDKQMLLGDKHIKIEPKRGRKIIQQKRHVAETVSNKKCNSSALSNPSPRTTKNVSVRVKKKKSNISKELENSSDDEEYELLNQSIISTRTVQRDAIQQLIGQLLSRWWYVLPPWPPVDFDFTAELLKRQYKEVTLEEWESADDIDSQGLTKVYPISYFKGVYRDPEGKAIDVRPLEGKPCYSSFKDYSEVDLYELLITAIRNQMRDIDYSPYRNTEQSALTKLKKELTLELKRLEDVYHRLKKIKN